LLHQQSIGGALQIDASAGGKEKAITIKLLPIMVMHPKQRPSFLVVFFMQGISCQGYNLHLAMYR